MNCPLLITFWQNSCIDFGRTSPLNTFWTSISPDLFVISNELSILCHSQSFTNHFQLLSKKQIFRNSASIYKKVQNPRVIIQAKKVLKFTALQGRFQKMEGFFVNRKKKLPQLNISPISQQSHKKQQSSSHSQWQQPSDERLRSQTKLLKIQSQAESQQTNNQANQVKGQIIQQEISCYLKMAQNYSMLARYQESLSAYQEVECFYSKLNRISSKQYSELLLQMAGVHKAMRNYELAQTMLRKALEISKKLRKQAGEPTNRVIILKRILQLQEIQKMQNEIKKDILHIQEEFNQKETNKASDSNQLQLQSIKDFKMFKKQLSQGKKLFQEQKYQKALNICQKISNTHPQENIKLDYAYAQLLSLQANCYKCLNYYQEAKDLYNKALNILLKEGNNKQPHKQLLIAEITINISQNEVYYKNYQYCNAKGRQEKAKIYKNQNYSQIIADFQAALQMALQVKDNLDCDIQKFIQAYIDNVILVGLIYEDIKDYQELHKLNVNACTFFKKINLEETVGFATLKYETGISWHYLKNYSQSNSCYFKSLQIMKKLGKEQKPENGRTLSKIAENYTQTRDYKKAIKNLESAYNFRIKLGGRDKQAAGYLIKKGQIHFCIQDYGRAESSFKQAYNILKKTKKTQQEKQALSDCLFKWAKVALRVSNFKVCLDKLHESVKLGIKEQTSAEIYEIVRVLSLNTDKYSLAHSKLNLIKKKIIQNEEK